MPFYLRKLILSFIFSAIFYCCYSQQLVTYPVAKEILYSHHNDDFTVRVRTPGGEWKDLYEYSVEVDMDNPQKASMVYFDFSGKVEVQVKKNNRDFRSVKVRPLSYGIKPMVSGNTISFVLSQPRNLSIEFDGEKSRNLHLFANAMQLEKVSPTDPNVIYFGPGLHKPANPKGFKIPSNTTVYLSGSAVLAAKLVCDSVENVRIIGRGIIDLAERGIEITHSKNVLVDGITFINPAHYTIYGGSSTDITIKNIRSFSSKGWSDGIDLMCCSNVNIDGVFMRNSDDCIAIYAHRWKFYGSVRNYKISNSTLWADVAHPINIGIHGNTEAVGDTIENISFKNIDILEHDEDDTDYQGAMALSVGDLNLVRNIRFENIRVDDFQEGQLFSLRVYYNKKYNTGPGRQIDNILFKDINYTGPNSYSSTINGLDKDHIVKGVVFKNLTINGKKMTSLKEANIKVGEFTQDVKLEP